MKHVNFNIFLIFLFVVYSETAYGNESTEKGEHPCLTSDDNVRYLVFGIPAITFIGSFPDCDSTDEEFYRSAFNKFLIDELGEKNISFSIDTQKNINENSIQKDSIAETLRKYNCSRCILPVECTIKRRTYKSSGWRDGKFGPSYERPEKTVVAANIVLKVLNAEGETIVQKTYEGRSRKPFMYGFFKRFAKKKDSTTLAESLYGPPALKSLYKAVNSFCIVQSSDR